MELFDAEKGLFHFVFANGKDYYYTDSAVRLTLHQYMYCELIRQGYKTAFFISGDDGSYELSMVNQDFFSMSEKKNALFDRIKIFQRSARTPEEFAGKKTINGKNNFEDCLDRMITIMNEHDHVAFFVPIETFKEFADVEGITKKLKDLSDKNHKSGNRHLILIHAPVNVEGSLDYIKDEKGIFRSGLFPEIDRIFNKKKNMYIYDELKNEFDTRMVFLNTVTRENVYNIVYRHFIRNETCFSKSFDMIDDYVDLIYFWHNSQAFREYAGKLFNEQDRRVFFNIEGSLCDKLLFSKITECINTIKNSNEGRESLKAWFFSNGYKLDRVRVPIVDNNSKITKLQQVYSRVQQKVKDYYMKQELSEQLLQTIKKLQKPSVIIYDDYCSLSYIERFVDFAYEATSDQHMSVDIQTLEKSLRAVNYAVQRICSITSEECEEFSEEADSRNNVSDCCYEMHMSILQSSVSLYTMQGEIGVLDRQIAKLETERKKAIEAVREFEILNPAAVKREQEISYGGTVTSEVRELVAKKESAGNLHKAIEAKKVVRAQKSSWTEKLKAAIQATETTLEMNFNGDLQNINNNVEAMLRKAKENIVNSNSLLQDISFSSDKFNDIMSEAEEMQSREVIPIVSEVNNNYREAAKPREISVEEEFEEVLQIYD
ncbi:MAG: hypothetical protein UD936_10195 [Acutalibacteraceae bacterium]|nr:hypothetical protein [Acutalibacteraceae bacterium]